MEVVRIPVLNDNYVWLLHSAGVTAVVDPAVQPPVEAALKKHGWSLELILNTHHHGDHVGANLRLKAAHGCTIVGPGPDRDRIPGIDVEVDEGDVVTVGDATARVLFVPGHTRGHIAYAFDDGSLFCGDVLFLGGCGRLFEGTPDQMFRSIRKLTDLPDETRIYCAHEYTLSNLRFAAHEHPENEAIRARLSAVEALRARNEPTVPGRLGLERSTNPFVMAATAAELGEIRSRKDKY